MNIYEAYGKEYISFIEDMNEILTEVEIPRVDFY